MRRLVFISALATLSTSAFSQVLAWEKPIAPGLLYRMETDLATPRVIHAIRWSQGAPALSARSEMAQMRIYAAPGGEAREEVSSLMSRTGAIAGINGDFFPTSGEPLGAMIREGQLLSRPFPGRATFGWGPTSSGVALLNWNCTATVDGIEPFNLQGINEDMGSNRIVLYTEASAEARSTQPSTYLLIRLDTIGFAPTGTAHGQVMEVVNNQPVVPVPPGYAILAGQGEGAARLSRSYIGANVRFAMQTTGFDWTKIDNVIGGGPMLLKAGKENIDFATANFNKSFSESRHPRTAAGKTANGDIWFVAVDGRQAMSVGASLKELAAIMLRLGCTDAVNLDGGGSTTLSVFGQALNRPSDGRERKVSNAILFFGPKPQATTSQLVVQGPQAVETGSLTDYKLIADTGKPIPDREVFWSAMGAGGWIDQGGTLRGFPAGGTVVIRAFSRGLNASLTVTVRPPLTPARTP